jgi:hypothetical protein
MTRISKFLALGAVAAIAVATALVLAPAGRAAVSAAPSLTVTHTAADIDHALGAFDAFKNRLDTAPRQTEAPQQIAERGACAQYAWPHIPQNCQSSANGRHMRQIRTVQVDTTSR